MMYGGTTSEIQDQINKRVYHASSVTRAYRDQSLLTRAEAMALLKYQPAFAGRDILDIGVGTGRTAAYLAPLARRYECIDYSPAMVEHVWSILPDISIHLGDMRDLSAFKDSTFDFVFASNNVIDAVSHEDRLRTLTQMQRVLRTNGTVIFSSHNRSFAGALNGPRIELSRNPVTLLINVARWERQLVHHARLAKFRRFELDYALLTDSGHDYACLHYYIEPRVQYRQLRDAGLEPLDALDHLGNSLPPNDEAHDSPWIMYVAGKPVEVPEST